MPVTSVVRVGCSWVEYQWTQYWKACMLDWPPVWGWWCVRGTGCGCMVLGICEYAWQESGFGLFLVCGKAVRGGVWCAWFGMLLGFEATSLLAWRAFHGFPVLLRGGGRGGACWLRGSWCFGVCPVFAAVASSNGVGNVGFLVSGCWCGGAGLLFGNCIVNASILQMR